MSDSSELEQAVETAVRKLYDEAGGNIPAGWILLVREVSPNLDRDGIGRFYPGESMPWTTALGMIEMTRVMMHSELTADD